MKVLVIRFSSIGDIVLTTPVVRCIKQQVPGVEIHYLTKEVFKSVLENNPYIDKLHFPGPSMGETAAALAAEEFDYIIDLHHNLRTKRLKMKLGVTASSFNKLNIQKWLLVNFKIDIMPRIHIVDRYLQAAAPLGIQNDQKGLDYFLAGEYDIQKLLPPAYHNGYVGIVIGAQHFTKRMPVTKLAEVCRAIDQPIVLLGGKEDAERAGKICSLSGVSLFNACGKFSLDESAFLVKMATRIITHDTGLMHIAAAFNKPVTSVWGNTVPKLGMYPYLVDQSTIVEHKHLWCRPCSKIGYSKCPLGHFKCMNELDAGEIAGNKKGDE